MRRRYLQRTSPLSPVIRIRFVKFIILFALSALLLRLWFLQCLYGDFYRDKSENNRIRTVRTIAPRGLIFDRNGKVLVRNRPSFTVALMLEDTADIEGTVRNVARIAGEDPDQVYEQFLSDRTSRRFEPKVILRDVSKSVLSKIKAKIYELPGVIVQAIPTRAYPYKDSASHLFGYVREINKKQLESNASKGYRIGDVYGQTGLEKSYESVLRGYSGYLQVEVDAQGSRKKELGLIDAVPGKDIQLTIDIDLQQAGEKALGENKGAIVALNPENGEILALVSSPRFDANIFSGQILADKWDSLIRDPSKPLTNRGISSAYPPGSTVKLLWGLAGLQEQLITPSKQISCPGHFFLTPRNKYHCHKLSGHGAIDLEMSITLSCNVYFYKLGQMLGIRGMSQYLKWFGFGQTFGLDIQGEESGILPSPEWKKKRFGEIWYPGDTVPVSIGQGYFIATPLQMAVLSMLISNDGKMYKPFLVRQKFDESSKEHVMTEPELLWEAPVNKEHFSLIRKYGGNVVSHSRGTGKRSSIPGISVGGKTGTAQVSKRGNDKDNEDLKDHAWFISYAPVEKPEIAIAVIVENVGGGGTYAAPVAREVLHTFFDKQGRVQNNEEDDNEKSKNVSGSSVAETSSNDDENVRSR